MNSASAIDYCETSTCLFLQNERPTHRAASHLLVMVALCFVLFAFIMYPYFSDLCVSAIIVKTETGYGRAGDEQTIHEFMSFVCNFPVKWE